MAAVVSYAAVPAHLNIEFRESESLLVRFEFERAGCLSLRIATAMNERLNSIVDAHVIVYCLIEIMHLQCCDVRIAAKSLLYEFLQLLMGPAAYEAALFV